MSLAKTSFLTVTNEAFQSLKESVASQESDILTREATPAGLSEDEFTKALSKLLSSKVKFVNNHLKSLADLKRAEGTPESEKTAYDLIEDSLLELA